MPDRRKGSNVSDIRTNPPEKIKKLQEQIRLLEEEKYMFRALLETIPDHIYYKDLKSRFILLSKALIDWFGANEIGDVVGKTDFDIFSDEHAHEAFEDEQNIMKSGVPIINKEEKETWEDGRITWVSTSKVPLKNTKGKTTGIVGISRDITEKIKTEAKLKKYRENLEASKKQTDDILANVGEGLFLLNNKFIISSQYSAELKNIFEDSRIANRSLLDILKNKVDPKTLEATRHFLECLFDDKHDEEMLKDLNPLHETEIQINKKKKYLTFNFKRIKKQKNRTSQIIVTVSDVTKEIILTQSLEEQKAETQRKMDWMLCILNIDPGMLREFIVSVQDEMSQIDQAMEILLDRQREWDVLNQLYRSLHTIKGNASLLELDFLADQAHHAEDIVTLVRDKMKLAAKDKKELTSQINSIHKTYRELRELINHIAKIHDQFRPKRSYEQKQLVSSLKKLVKSVSEHYNKKVSFDNSSFDTSCIPYQYRLFIRDILIQMVRNAVYHGIESEDQRMALGKETTGKIKISTNFENGSFILAFEDDGKGIDLEKLRAKVLESGKWPQSEINAWKKQDIIKTIFEPGITTSDFADITAGRGVGMDIIRQKVSKAGGKIDVQSEPDKFTRFTIILPAKKSEEQVV